MKPSANPRSGMNLHEISLKIQRFASEHTLATCIGASAFVLIAAIIVLWYEVFSGLAEPIQFIYAEF